MRRPADRRVIDNVNDESVIDNTEELVEMGKRNNYAGGSDAGQQIETRRGGGRVLLALILVVGGIYAVHTTSAYLQKFVPVAAGSDVNLGTWAVGGLVAVFLAWCFLSGSSGSKGDRR